MRSEVGELLLERETSDALERQMSNRQKEMNSELEAIAALLMLIDAIEDISTLLSQIKERL